MGIIQPDQPAGSKNEMEMFMDIVVHFVHVMKLKIK